MARVRASFTVCAMPANETRADSTIYNGQFRHGVDTKRRIQVPARWRPSNPEIELTVLVWRKHEAGACLRVLPPERMADLLAHINGLPNGHPDKAVLKRNFGSNSIQVSVDKAGRFCLPEKMAADAGIEKEAVMVGLLDSFEIWEPRRFSVADAADQTRLASAMDHLD